MIKDQRYLTISAQLKGTIVQLKRRSWSKRRHQRIIKIPKCLVKLDLSLSGEAFENQE